MRSMTEGWERRMFGMASSHQTIQTCSAHPSDPTLPTHLPSEGRLFYLPWYFRLVAIPPRMWR